MEPTRKDEERVETPGRSLGDIDPGAGATDDMRPVPDRADDRQPRRRSTHVNDGDVGEERRDREVDDPQRNPRTGPIG